MKVVEHKVRSVDTIQSLAATYLYNAERWRDIVDFNNLDYPYLSADPDFQTQVKASGQVKVTRTYLNAPLTIMAGTVFVAPVVDGVPSRTYVSVTNVPIPAGTATALIPVECTVAGLWGNIPSYTISDIQTDDPVLRGAFDFIGNPQGFSNGNTLNVKMLGDSLLIPVDDSWNGDAFYEDLNSFYERFFGADLELGDDGDLTFDGYGDVGSVIGVGNLAQAVRDRLITPKLSLVYHPEYGSILGQIAAEGVTPYTQKWAALAIKETLLADDRVGSVNVVNLDIRGPVLNVVVDVTPVNQGEAVRISAGLANLLAV